MQSSPYAITRSLKGLTEAGFVENVSSGQNEYARLTNEGKRKVHSINLESGLISTKWDGYWRMIILDLSEERKSEREALRYLLKKAGFICVKNSVWVSMYPYENLFTSIKKDLGLTNEMMILVTDKIDEETEKELIKLF
jgi:DNA-binding transcriptional regulator PaaX